MRKLVIAAVAAAAFLITPYFIYDALFGYDFGEADMRAAVEGTWKLELSPRGGAPRSVTFRIEQAREAARPAAPAHSSRERGWIRSAAACGHRTFIRSAEACKDISEMTLTLTAVGADPAPSMSGSFSVAGTAFDRGELEIRLDDHAISATVTSTGAVLEVSASGGAQAKLARAHPAGA